MIKKIDSIMTVYGDYIIIGAVILFILLLYIKYVNKRIRKLAFKGIPKAEEGSIINSLKPSLYKWVDNFDKKEYDQRMVEVIAYIIQYVPILKIIPRGAVTKYVSIIVQKVFDNLKASLDVQRRPNHGKITEDMVSEINPNAQIIENKSPNNDKEQLRNEEKISQILSDILKNVDLINVGDKIDKTKIDYIKSQIEKIL